MTEVKPLRKEVLKILKLNIKEMKQKMIFGDQTFFLILLLRKNINKSIVSVKEKNS